MSDFSSYFKLYGEKIYRYLRKILKDEETAKDILQETFLRAMRMSIDEDKVENYLFRIAHNLAMDYFKDSQRYVDIEEDCLSDNRSFEPMKLLEDRDIWKPLSPIEKSILMLHYHEGYSYEEISEKLNIPLNTVKSHVHRAKKKIYNYLKEE